MRPALFIPIFGELADPRAVAQVAATAEAAGWQGVFVWDHMAYRPPVTDIGDPWIALAAIAMATESMRIGPMVTPPARRRPHMLARETASLDVLSDGRLVLGVGLGGRGRGDPEGDPGDELAATGEERDPRQRAAMLDEALVVLDALWSGEAVHHAGEHYTIDGSSFRPRPLQRPRPPVWVAGRYPFKAPLRRALRWDGWFPIGLERPDQLAEMLASVGVDALPAGFDVAVGDDDGVDPAPWAAAGVTWWLTGFSPFTLTLDEVAAVAAAGPPC